MSMQFTRATKRAAKARIALEGPSGSGKTYSSLSLAKVLGNNVGLVDTERGSASKYSDLFAFSTLELDRFAPDVLVEALASGAQSGLDVLIVDSLSHFWMGIEGMLEQVDRAAKRSGGGNSFAGWKEMRPTERRMIDALLAYPGHIIVTLRTKTEWVVEVNDKGKNVPRKVGLKAEQREGLEYEFDIVGALDLDLDLTITKTRCPVLAGAVIRKPGEELGNTILAWLGGDTAGPSAIDLRDRLLADPAMSVDDIKAVYRQVRAAGLLGAAIVDEHGDTVTLGEWIVARGKQSQAQVQAPAEVPSTPRAFYDARFAELGAASSMEEIVQIGTVIAAGKVAGQISKTAYDQLVRASAARKAEINGALGGQDGAP